MGRAGHVAYGNVATHFYFELDTKDLDIALLTECWNRIIDRHGMLRAVVNADGTQQVLKTGPKYTIDYVDVSADDDDSAKIQLLKTRTKMEQQVLPTNEWPLFDFKATKLPDSSTRLHISLDLLICDAWSMFLFFKEWFDLYHKPDLKLTPIPISF